MNTPETVRSFTFVEDDEPVVVVDRSTLERFAICPAQAQFMNSGLVLNESFLATVGNEVHRAFGEAIYHFMQDYPCHTSEIAKAAERALNGARPDIQPEAIDAGRPSIWSWASFLNSYHPSNVVRYDGGIGDRSGQLAWDLPMGDVTLRITSELDLLLATTDPKAFLEADYKSGWKVHTAKTVEDAFQFCTHAVLVFKNYPDVERLAVEVWNTRRNSRTYPVMFKRERLAEYESRIRYAAGEYVRWRNTAPENTDVWPSLEKCPLCPAAALCPASLHVGDVAADPEGFVGLMVALDAKLDAMKKLAAAHVKAKGDLQTKAGCYGYEKPKTTKGQRMGLYTMAADDSEESEATSDAAA